MFNGPVYEKKHDFDRLSTQIDRIKKLMMDGKWRTLRQISQETKDPPASISAQLRHLRKYRFGSFILEKRSKGLRKKGLWEYRLAHPTDKHIEKMKSKRKRKIKSVPKADSFGEKGEWQTSSEFRKEIYYECSKLEFIVEEESIDDLMVILSRLNYINFT